MLTAYPNPFPGKVNISFTAKESGPTQLSMYDARGERARILFDGVLSKGSTRKLEVEAEELIDGVYILRLVNGHHIKHFKLILTR